MPPNREQDRPKPADPQWRPMFDRAGNAAVFAFRAAAYLLCVYIFMLGLVQFFERHPAVDRFVTAVFPVAAIAALVVVLVYYGRKFWRGFRDGVREAREDRSA